MKERLKQWWQRRPRLRRGHKLALNLTLSLVLAILFWGQNGYPLPTAEMEFRRLERTNLLARSEIIFTQDVGDTWANSIRRQKEDVVVGQTREHVVVGYIKRGLGYLECWPLENRPTLVPLNTLVSRADEMGQPHTGNALLLMQLPERAYAAIIKTWGREQQPEGEEWTQGQRLEQGLFYFWMPFPDGSGTSRDLEGLPYELTLYEKDGTVLLEQSGTLPTH